MKSGQLFPALLAMAFAIGWVSLVPAQNIKFETSAPIKNDTLRVIENKEANLVYNLKLTAEGLENPIAITLITRDHAGAQKGQDYSTNLSANGTYALNRENEFTQSFILTILNNPYEEATEYFSIICSFKDREGKKQTKTLIVAIAKPTTEGQVTKPVDTEMPKAKVPENAAVKRHIVYNNGFPCTTSKHIELTLTALERDKKLEELEISWSARDKADVKDTFNLAGNKTYFGNKAAALAKTIAGEDCTDSAFRDTLDKAFDEALIKIRAAQKKIEENTEEGRLKKLTDSITNLVKTAMDAVALEEEDAAIVQLQSDFITLHKKSGNCKFGSQNQNESFNRNDLALKIDSVTFRVFNNTIHQLDIVGTIDGQGVQTISNNDYGLPLRNFIDKGSSIDYCHNGGYYSIYYRELFLIRPPKDGAINYTLKDGNYTVYPSTSTQKPTKVPVAQKRLLDYFSVSAFFDFLSLDQNNPNKSLFTEAYFRFNINTVASKRLTWFKQLYATINLAANITGKQNANMPTAYDSIKTIGNPSITDYKYYGNSLDTYTYAYFQARPMLNIATLDYKKANLIVEGNVGLHTLGTPANIINPAAGIDSAKVKNLFSVSPALEARFRVTPKSNFGFDFHLSYLPGFRPLNADFKTLSGKESIAYLSAQAQRQFSNANVIIGELNFFFNPKRDKSATDRGGFYFRMNLAKSTHYGMGHFMFLAGYSSDIKTFMR